MEATLGLDLSSPDDNVKNKYKYYKIRGTK
jgi:hypothetical protein